MYLGAKLEYRVFKGIMCWTISSDKYINAAIENIEKKLKLEGRHLSRRADTPMSYFQDWNGFYGNAKEQIPDESHQPRGEWYWCTDLLMQIMPVIMLQGGHRQVHSHFLSEHLLYSTASSRTLLVCLVISTLQWKQLLRWWFGIPINGPVNIVALLTMCL